MAELSGTGGSINLGSGGRLTTGVLSAGASTATVITGNGNFTVDAGALSFTLRGNNTYTGTTTVSSGLLVVGDGTTNGSLGSGNVVNNGARAFNRSDIVTVANAISGSGAVRQAGPGTTILTGSNSYSGGTTVSNGTLQGTTSSLQGAITNNANVTFDQASNGTYTGAMSGAGAVTVTGGGTVTFSGANSYDGGTTVSGGSTLQGTTTSLQGDITNNATVAFNQATNGTYAGTMSGSGAVTVSGGGTVTFSRANTYGGATTIDSGTLALTGNASLASSSGVTVAGGATFDVTGNTSFTTIRNLAGAGTVQINNRLIVSSASGTFAGVIAGSNPATSGLTVAGGGTFTLTGTNTYVGLTQIDAGTTLALSGSGSIASASLIALAGSATFDISQKTSDVSVDGLAGGGTVSLGSRTLTSISGSSFSGVIQDGGIGGGTGGSLIVSGAGGQNLGGVNTYTGSTTVTAGGLLVLSGNGSIASSSGLNLSGAGAQLDISGANGNVTIKDLTGVAGSIIQTGTNFLVVGTANSTTFAGVIDDSSAVGGGLIKQGSGTLTLSGANLYTGGTQLNAGTLAIANNSALGTGGLTFAAGTTLQAVAPGLSIGNAMTLAASSAIDTQENILVLSGVLSGGASTKIGNGTLVLSGVNTYTGGATVSAGTLQGTTDSLRGNILNNAAVSFAGGGTYAGNMSGIGSLTKVGPGTLVLTGSNSYSGGTMVTDGTLQGTTWSLQGTIVNNATVAFSQASTGTYAGNMSGTGGVTIGGGGTVIYTGNNTYTGGTSIAAGSTLQLGNGTAAGGSLVGNIANNGLLVFDQPMAATYGGVMSGSGGFTLQQGIVTVTGNNTYTGATMVNGGMLVVNGSLASAVTLNNGSTLGGTGNIGALVANNAIIAPGNSIGTLTVNGNFSQTGGTYVVEANAAGQSDRINATGTATINGGTVQVAAASGSYANSTTYTILNATGGVSGAYSNVTSNFAFLTPSLTYNVNNVLLTLALQGAAFSGFGGNTGNQRAVGSALDQSYTSATGDFATVIGALAGLNTQQGPYALNQISGQPYADFGTFNVANNALFMNALGQQMAQAREGARGGSGSGQRQALAEACDIAACDGASPFSVWGSVLGGVGSVQGNGNSSTFTYNVGGAAAGIDYRVSPSVLVGIGAGYSSGTQWVDSFQGKGLSNSVSVAAYASFTQWGAYLDALAGYAYSNNQLQRQISIPNLQPRTANGSTGANQFLAQAEAGYKIGLYAPAAASITPFARFQTSSINQAAFNEWGANSLSLNVAQQTTTSVRTVLGAELAAAIGSMDLGLRLGWLHEYADTARPVTAAFAGAPSANFTVYGATPQRDAAVIGFQASATVATATQLYLRYDGDIGSGTDNHALNVGLRLSW